MRDTSKQRARDQIISLAGQGLDVVAFWSAATEAMARVVPYYLTPCWYTLDPLSILITSHYQNGMPEIPAEWLAYEYAADNIHSVEDVVRSARGISTLHDVTGGDPRRSSSYELYMQPNGVEQELLVALRTRSGEAWGALGLYREVGWPRFTSAELGFLQAIAPYLAEGARRGLLVGEASDPDGPESPGLVVLRHDLSVESLTPGVAQCLEELPDGDWKLRQKLPPAVLAVAGRALRTAEHADAPGEIAIARVLSRTGRWMVLHGAALVADGSRRVAVIIEPAHPGRIGPLLMAAYGLSEREQEVTRLVLQGNATAEIAERLVVSAHTVQQHLKRVFEKTGVRSRRELVGKVFFTHYEPRVRDNEKRAQADRPLRGGPLAERSASPHSS